MLGLTKIKSFVPPERGFFFPFWAVDKIGNYLRVKNLRFHKFTLKGKNIAPEKVDKKKQNRSSNIFFVHKNADVVKFLKDQHNDLDLSNYDRALHSGGQGAKFFISADDTYVSLQWEILERALKLSPSLNRSVPRDPNTEQETYDLIAEQAESAVNETIANIYESRKKISPWMKFIKEDISPNKVDLVKEYGHSVTHIFVRDFLGIEIPVKSKLRRGKVFANWIFIMFFNLFANPGSRIPIAPWLSRLTTRKYIRAIDKSYEDPKEGSLLSRLKTIERTSLHDLEITAEEYRKIVVNILMEIAGSFQKLTGDAFSNILKSIDEENKQGKGENPHLSNDDFINLVSKVKDSPRGYINEYLRLNSPTKFIFRTAKRKFRIVENDEKSEVLPGDLLCLLTEVSGRDSLDASSINPKRECPHYVHFGVPDEDPSDLRPKAYHPCFGQYWAHNILETMLEGLLKFKNLRVEKKGGHKSNKYMAVFDPEPENQSFVSIILEVPKGYRAITQHCLEHWGNPADSNLETKLQKCDKLHFISINVVEGKQHVKSVTRRIGEFIGFTDPEKPLRYEPDYLLIEMSVDGSPVSTIDELSEHLSEEFYDLIHKSNLVNHSKPDKDKQKDYKKSLVAKVLHKNAYTLVQSFWPTLFTSKATTGLPFTGTPGLSRQRIIAEDKLAETIANIVDEKSKVVNKASSEAFKYNTPHARLFEIRKFLSEQKNQHLNELKWVMGGSKPPSFAEEFNDPWIPRLGKAEEGIIENFTKVIKLFPRALIVPVILIFLFIAGFLQFDEIEFSTVKADYFQANAGTITGYILVAILLGNVIGVVLRNFKNNGLGRMGEMFIVSGFFLFFIAFFDHNILFKPALEMASSGNQDEYKVAHPLFENGMLKSAAELKWFYLGLALGVIFSGIIALREFFGRSRKLGAVHTKPLAFLLLWTLLIFVIFQHGFWLSSSEAANFVQNRLPRTSLMDFIFYPLQYSVIIVFSFHAYVKSFLGSPNSLGSMRNISLFFGLFLFLVSTVFLPEIEIKNLIGFVAYNLIIIPLLCAFFLLSIYQKFSPATSSRRIQVRNSGLSIFLFAFLFSGLINLNPILRNYIIAKTGQNPKAFSNIISKNNSTNVALDYLNVALDYLNAFVIALPITLLIIGLIVLFNQIALRKSETQNIPHDSDTKLSIEEAMLNNENAVGFEQNHMISIQRLLPEWMRIRFLLPLSLHVFSRMVSTDINRPGFLGNIGTVHFARWVQLPRSRNYAFISNYDGSFESYLEDFVTKVNEGLNVVWSHCVGFPLVKNIISEGSKDGDRFIRWSRGSMKPTPFWYSAYPNLTVEIIRRNALIRDGLVRIRTASDAEAWFDLFNSTTRPEHALQTDQIQSYVFGGAKHLTHGCCLVIKSSSPEDERTLSDDFKHFVASINDKITYGQKRPENEAIYFAITRIGLDLLGIGCERYRSHEWKGDLDIKVAEEPTWFSGAFASGMNHPVRKRALGDENKKGWNNEVNSDSEEKILGTVLLYTDPSTGVNLEDLVDEFDKLKTTSLTFKKIDFVPLKSDALPKEPFGFVDGVSNPIIRGTKNAARNPNSIHLVNPGEFILGYRDNRDYFPASPQIYASQDISRILPAIPNEQPQKYPNFSAKKQDSLRDLGRNGTYLVIRQLEQNVTEFKVQSRKKAKEIAGELINGKTQTTLSEIYAVKKKFGSHSKFNLDRDAIKIALDEIKIDELAKIIEAKMIGRWQDGQSLTTRPIYLNEISFATWLDHENITFSSQKGLHLKDSDAQSHSPTYLAQDNEYLFGRDDPQGYGCPFGSHVRRTNPRESLEAGSAAELEVSNRHRILRRGRSYISSDKQETGTLFMCLNVDIDRQFEFVQQTWTNGRHFHGLRDEYDPISDKAQPDRHFTIQCPGANKNIQVTNFVKFKGGEYFFMPGRDTMTYFAITAISMQTRKNNGTAVPQLFDGGGVAKPIT